MGNHVLHEIKINGKLKDQSWNVTDLYILSSNHPGDDQESLQGDQVFTCF